MAAHDDFTNEDWTATERAMLASLPEERIAPNDLKARTIEALYDRGLLGARSASGRTRVLALIAAAALIFFTGALVGYSAARRSATPVDTTRAATSQDVARASGATSNNPPTRHVVWY